MRQSINYFLGMLALFVLFAACTRNRPAGDVTTTDTLETATVVSQTISSGPAVIPANAPLEPNASVVDSSAVEGNTRSIALPTAAPAAATPINQSSAANARTFQYTVQPGDTLFSIGDKYGTDLATIQQLNFLFDENIRAGQVLRLPLLDGFTQEGRPTPTPLPFFYPIQSGDTLTAIALKFGVDTNEIVRVNRIVDTDSLYVGQEIIIPGRTANSVTAASPANAAAGVAGTNSGVVFDSSSTNVDNINNTTNQAVHIVSPGEGLLEIAERYDVLASDIVAANNIQNRELLRSGQRLFIPGVSASQAAVLNNVVHTVAPGQGLNQIAVQYGVDTEAIITANNINNPELIYPGQRLIIPTQ